MNAALAFCYANPLLVLTIVGAIVSTVAKATASRAPGLSAFLYRVVAPFPADCTRMLANGPVTPAQKAAIEAALLERVVAALARGETVDAQAGAPEVKP